MVTWSVLIMEAPLLWMLWTQKMTVSGLKRTDGWCENVLSRTETRRFSGYCGSPDSSTLLEAGVTANTEAKLPHFWEVLVLLLSNPCWETCRIIFTMEKWMKIRALSCPGTTCLAWVPVMAVKEPIHIQHCWKKKKHQNHWNVIVGFLKIFSDPQRWRRVQRVFCVRLSDCAFYYDISNEDFSWLGDFI